ncbi:MAG: hypothetical protein H7Y27_15515 [Gemmatimonadaceae bacterium]|nr:hypothetical protein [Chitinophagaceae bacterium]
MPFMKFLTIFSFIVSFSVAGFSQGPKITYSEPEREDSRRTVFEIIGKLNGNHIVYKANRGEDAFCIYDNEMKLKERIKVDITPDQVINVDFIAYPEHFFMVYQYQKKGVVNCVVAKFDGNAQKMMEPVLLDTTEIGWAANNKIYSMVNSDDKQRIMVFKINSKNQKNFLFTTILFNNAFEMLDKKRMSIGMEERNDYFTDFTLSNDGDLVFGKFVRQNFNEYINKLTLVTKYPDSLAFSEKEIDIGGRLLDEVKIKIDNSNKRVLINAFYYKQKRGNIEGLYTVIWDKQTNQRLKEMTSVFSEDLRVNAKSVDGNARTAFNDYFIKNIIARRDGGYMIIAESEYTSSRGGAFNRWDYLGGGNPWLSPGNYYYSPMYNPWSYPYSRWNNSAITRYHAENIMVLSYSKEGSIEWSNVIPKSQFDDETDNMVSFQLMNTGSDLHFLFNLYERRTLMLNDQSVAPDGKVTRNPTLKNLDKGYEFMPRYAKQVSARQMIVPCLYRNYLCFAKIDF